MAEWKAEHWVGPTAAKMVEYLAGLRAESLVASTAGWMGHLKAEQKVAQRAESTAAKLEQKLAERSVATLGLN